MTRSLAAKALVALLSTMGVLHFVAPRFFDAIVPKVLPGPARGWTYVSGVAELACAAAVAVPSTRRTGGRLAALLFVAVFPANVQMALDARGKSAGHRIAAYGRLPFQIPLVLWALRVSRQADGGQW